MSDPAEFDRAEFAAQVIAIADAIDAFHSEHGRDPTDDELADLAAEAVRASSYVH